MSRALVLLALVAGCTSQGRASSLARRAAGIDLPQVAAVRPGEPRAPVAIEIHDGVIRLDAAAWRDQLPAHLRDAGHEGRRAAADLDDDRVAELAAPTWVSRRHLEGHLIVPLYDWLAWADGVALALDDRMGPDDHLTHVEILAAASAPMIDVVEVLYTVGRVAPGRLEMIARGPDGPGRLAIEAPKFCCLGEERRIRSCVALRFTVDEGIEVTAWRDHDYASCRSPRLDDEADRLLQAPVSSSDGPEELAAQLKPWQGGVPICRLTEITFRSETPYEDVARVMGVVQALQPDSRFALEVR